MGKALLIIVLSSSLVLITQLFSTVENESRTAKDQRGYQEDVIAREIAQSAFNVGMGEVRAFGERVLDGTVALNGANGDGRAGAHSTGRFAGGSYTVRALPTSGHSARIVGTGTYGDATFTMHDEYRMPALMAREDGLMVVSPPQSTAGYSSAVFYQAYPIDLAEGEVPEIVMLFPADNKDRPTTHKPQTIYVEAGTQLNFFIGVDQNGSMELDPATSECEVRSYSQNYVFNPSDFDYIHYALDVESGKLDQVREAPWAFVEQHPDDRQRWRIGWEDKHLWNDPATKDITKSLQATKTYGYYGTGWPAVNSQGYRQLENFSTKPDFSDQVIEVRVTASSDPSFFGRQTSERAKQAVCGEGVDEEVVPEPEVITDPQIIADLETIATSGTVIVTEPVTNDALTTFACSCTNNGQYNTPILHRPPGNESNEQLICIPEPAIVNAHMKHHDDVRLTCDSRQNVRRINRN